MADRGFPSSSKSIAAIAATTRKSMAAAQSDSAVGRSRAIAVRGPSRSITACTRMAGKGTALEKKRSGSVHEKAVSYLHEDGGEKRVQEEREGGNNVQPRDAVP